MYCRSSFAFPSKKMGSFQWRSPCFHGVGSSENGFVRVLRAEAPKPFELLDGAAVMALRLGMIAQEQRPAIGLAGHAVEAFTEEINPVLGASDFDVPVTS